MKVHDPHQVPKMVINNSLQIMRVHDPHQVPRMVIEMQDSRQQMLLASD